MDCPQYGSWPQTGLWEVAGGWIVYTEGGQGDFQSLRSHPLHDYGRQKPDYVNLAQKRVVGHFAAK